MIGKVMSWARSEADEQIYLLLKRDEQTAEVDGDKNLCAPGTTTSQPPNHVLHDRKTAELTLHKLYIDDCVGRAKTKDLRSEEPRTAVSAVDPTFVEIGKSPNEAELVPTGQACR